MFCYSCLQSTRRQLLKCLGLTIYIYILFISFFFREIKNINFEKVKGFILNVPSNSGIGFISLPFKFKHWIVIRNIKDTYYNLDSKLSSPENIGVGDDSLIEYLCNLLKLGNRELLLVIKPEDSDLWYHTLDVHTRELENHNREQSNT